MSFKPANIKTLLLFSLFLIITAFLALGINLANAEECEPSWSNTNNTRCVGSCGGTLQRQQEDGCGNTRWVTKENCNSWEKCDATKNDCSCAGECLDAPQNEEYYANPATTILQSDYPYEGNDDIYLPVALAWDNVSGWNEDTGPSSYNIKIDNTTRDFLHPDPDDPSQPIGDPPPAPEEGLLAWPLELKNIRVTSNFAQDRSGWDMDVGHFHLGTDFVQSGFTNPPIYAAAEGKVTIARYIGTPGRGAGNTVRINHGDITGSGDNLYTQYLHLHSMFVSPGDKVEQGQQIGRMGTTGASTGVHLHLDVCLGSCWSGGVDRGHDDPLKYLDRNQLVFAETINYIRNHSNMGRATYYVPGYVPKYVSDKETPPEDLYNGEMEDPYENDLLLEKSPSDSRIDLAALNKDNSEKIAGSSYKLTSSSSGKALETTVSRNNFNADRCLLRPGDTHNWKVQACCSTDGTDCGKWSSWPGFQTNEAPEPLSPYDSGWVDPESMAGTHHNPIDFKDANPTWCDHEREEDYKAYLLYAYKEIGGELECHPDRVRLGGLCEPVPIHDPSLVPIHRGDPPTKLINKNVGLFDEKGEIYGWQIAACKDHSRKDCTDYGQIWKFIVSGGLENPSGLSPLNDPEGRNPIAIHPSAYFEWNKPFGAHSYYFQLERMDGEGGTIERHLQDTNTRIDIDDFALNTDYRWRLRSCYDENGDDCNDTWTDWHKFTTTGRPPDLNKTATPYNKAQEVLIPLNAEWGAVSGAKSYVFELFNKEGDKIKRSHTSTTRIRLDYPKIKTEESYSWTVETCADPGTDYCGGFFTPPVEFTTFTLYAPSVPSPQDNAEIFTEERNIDVSWNAIRGANYYKYEVIFPDGEKEKEIISDNNFFLRLFDLGDYEWRVKSCLDSECEESGDFSPWWSFNYYEVEVDGVGLVPCGRTYNSPDTDWNERESCQPKHLLILFKVLIDFVLWNLFPVAIGLMILATGAIFYLSPSLGTEVLARVKAVWRAVGIGFVILFFGWLILTMGMPMIGYDTSIYGFWWQIEL